LREGGKIRELIKKNGRRKRWANSSDVKEENDLKPA